VNSHGGIMTRKRIWKLYHNHLNLLWIFLRESEVVESYWFEVCLKTYMIGAS